MSLNQRVTAEFSTCTPSAPPTADLSIQTTRESAVPTGRTSDFDQLGQTSTLWRDRASPPRKPDTVGASDADNPIP